MTPANPRTKRTFKAICSRCGKSFDAESDRARYCGAACKMQAYRARKQKQAES